MDLSDPQDFNAVPPPGSSIPTPSPRNLTSRELGILDRIIRGLSSKEIARLLVISPRTVEFHRANLLKKFCAKNTADLVRRALGE